MSLRAFARFWFARLPLRQRDRLRLIEIAYRLAGARLGASAHFAAWQGNRQARRDAAAQIELPRDPGAAPLRLDRAAAPRWSIVLLDAGAGADRDASLASIAALLREAPGEALAAGAAGAGDGAAAVPGLRILPASAGATQAAAAAAALRAARGEFVLLLHAGQRAVPGLLARAEQAWARHPQAAVLALRVLDGAGRLQSAGALVHRDGSLAAFGAGADPLSSEFAVEREIDAAAAGAACLRRAPVEAAGGLDGAYLGLDAALAELSLRLRAADHGTVYAPALVLRETARPARSAPAPADTQRLAHRWRERLEREHLPAGAAPELAVQRPRGAPIVLVVDQYLPRPARDAGSRSVDQMIEALQEMGWIVHFWPETLWDDPQEGPRLRARGVEVYYGARHAGTLAQVAGRLGARLAAVVLIRPRIAAAHLAALRRASRARIAYYGIDIHFLRLQRQAEVQPGSVAAGEAGELERIETAVWRQVDATLYPSTEELRIVGARAPGHLAVLLPLYAFAGPHPAPPRAARRPGKLLFVGGFTHAPNVDAVLWFAREVLPALRAAAGPLRLVVIGSQPPASVRALQGPDVEVLGWVDDANLLAHYDSALVSVVPLRWGAGVKGKVVESLQYGLPLVTTPIGAEGLAPAPGVMRVAADAAAFVEAVRGLLESPAAWDAQSAAQRAYAAEHFSRAALRRALQQALTGAAPAGAQS
jgi:glycosyltransferase involved in cell wall biosynthesis